MSYCLFEVRSQKLEILLCVTYQTLMVCSYFTVISYHRCEIWCPSDSDDHCPDDQLCFAFSKCHAVDQNGMTMEQMEKQKNEYQNFNNNNKNGGGGGGNNEEWWEPGTDGNNGNGGNNGLVQTARPTTAEQAPGYYNVKLGSTTRPTRDPTKRPTKNQ